jgi:DNA-binding NarL/FixJ family response regulator
MIDVAVVENDHTIRAGLKVLIDGTEGYRCVADYSDCECLLADILTTNPDVLLMDIGIPGMSGIAGVQEVKKLIPDLVILIFTIYEDQDSIFHSLSAGASGYLVKNTSPARLLEAIREAYHGGSPMSSHIARKVVDFFQQRQVCRSFSCSTPLTAREQEVLKGLANGNTYKTIADSLNISVDTIRHHIRNIYKKLQVHSQSEAVAKSLRNGLLGIDSLG